MAEFRRDWVTLAVLLRPRGLKGEIVADAFGSDPERFEKLTRGWIFGSDESAPLREVEIESAWPQKGAVVLKFRGIDSVEDVEKLAKTELRIPVQERPPAPEGEFYHSDLIGCDVFLKDGTLVGPVVDWRDYGASGLLAVMTEKGEVLIPFAKAICIGIEPEAKRIVIDPPDGLLD